MAMFIVIHGPLYDPFPASLPPLGFQQLKTLCIMK